MHQMIARFDPLPRTESSYDMPRKYPKPRPTVIDFFCGAGGMSLGFEQAGFDVVLGVDVDGHHAATHDRNFPYGKTLCASISALGAARIYETLGTDREIDVVVGGPPCQGFSNMGVRDAKDPRNSLIDHYVRLVLELRPRAFVMENVPGMLAGETRKILDGVVRAAEENGYAVAKPVRVLDAADFGVPQQRRRLFVIGVRRDVAEGIQYPEGICHGQPERPTVWEAIGDLPLVDRLEGLFERNDAPYGKRPSSHYAKVARGFEVDPSDLSIPRVWDETLCTGCLRTKHSTQTTALYAATEPGQTVPGHKLPRLHPNGMCPTLRAGSDSSHGAHTAPRPIHPKLPRCITSREAARLHGFPDWFAFYPLKWHAYRQIGNAVCPPVARALGHTIRDALGGRSTAVPPKAIPLGNAFELPENRPRSLKRIPLILQYPPVIDALFARAFDASRNVLAKPTFSFADVQRAIGQTGVNLTWAREDNFLSDLARSRRVKDILAGPLSKGYSIAPDRARGAIGKFVPAGTPGAIDDKTSLVVRVDDLHQAAKLKLPAFDLNGNGWGVVAILSERSVQRELWGRDDCVVGLRNTVRSPNSAFEGTHAITLRRFPTFESESSAVVTCDAKSLPNRDRLATIGRRFGSDSLTVLVGATNKHLIAVQFENCTTLPIEANRGSFVIA